MGVVDDPSTRVGRFTIRIDQIDRTFFAAGVDPADPESRERFGEDHRKMREWLERKERRGKWLAGSATAIALAVMTALIVSKGPALLLLLAQMGK